MGSVVAKHNKKILKNSTNAQPKPKATCNCQKKEDCPVPGECNQNGAIYQATVLSAGGRVETYVGLAKISRRVTRSTRKIYWMSPHQAAPHCRIVFGKRQIRRGTLK